MKESISKRVGSPEIASSLRREIVTGEFENQQRLPPERELASHHRVARGTIREALSQLAEEGLLKIKAGSGAYVTYDSTTESSTHGVSAIYNTRPLELIDSRFALEPHICRLAVLHARKHELDRMEVMLLHMEDNALNPVTFSQADTDFHTLLSESTGNSLLIWFMTQINSVRNQEQWSRMRLLTLNEETIKHYNIQHRKILSAIQAREPELAANSMKAHLEYARLSLTRSAST